MTLARWKPFGDLVSMHGKINRLFEDAFGKDDMDRGYASLDSWYPVTDIFETKDDYVFKMEVPGLAKDEINIEFSDNSLHVKGERKETKEVERENYHRIESWAGSFSRSFSLPRDTDAAKINAEMKNGILELRIAKAEEKKAKAIPIKVK